MQKSRLASLIDTLIVSASCTFLTLIISQKLSNNLMTRLLLSSLTGVLVFCAFFKREKNKYKNQQLKLKEEKHMKNCILAFLSMENNAQIAFLNTILEKSKHAKNSKNFCIFSDLCAPQTTLQSLSNFLQNKKQSHLDLCFVITNSMTNDAKDLMNFASEFLQTKFELISPTSLYLLMKNQNTFPQKMPEPENTSSLKKIKTLFSDTFTRKRAKHYFLLSVALTISSLLLPFHKYYFVFACIALSLTIVTLIFGKPTPKPNN